MTDEEIRDRARALLASLGAAQHVRVLDHGEIGRAANGTAFVACVLGLPAEVKPASLADALTELAAIVGPHVANLTEADVRALREGEPCGHCRWRKATHGACCTCQRCGLDHDSCHCDLDQMDDEIDALKAQHDARVTELINANSRLVQERRAVESELDDRKRERDDLARHLAESARRNRQAEEALVERARELEAARYDLDGSAVGFEGYRDMARRLRRQLDGERNERAVERAELFGVLHLVLPELYCLAEQVHARPDGSVRRALAAVQTVLNVPASHPKAAVVSPPDHGTHRVACLCPGCPQTVPACWESWMCRPCATEDCDCAGDVELRCADAFGCDPSFACFDDPSKCSKRPAGEARS